MNRDSVQAFAPKHIRTGQKSTFDNSFTCLQSQSKSFGKYCNEDIVDVFTSATISKKVFSGTLKIPAIKVIGSPINAAQLNSNVHWPYF